MSSDTAADIALLDGLLQELEAVHNGLFGNCAQVAVILDEALDTDGDYVVVAGEHYEYADHVFVRWEGLLWDIQGGRSWEEAEQTWCEADEDDEDSTPELEEFSDPSGAAVVRLADPNNPMAAGFDPVAFRRDLIAGLAVRGFTRMAEDLQQEAPSPPAAPKARKPR